MQFSRKCRACGKSTSFQILECFACGMPEKQSVLDRAYKIAAAVFSENCVKYMLELERKKLQLSHVEKATSETGEKKILPDAA
jgi:ribosomal protein L37E